MSGIDKDKIIGEFNLIKFGNKGWRHNLSFNCPFCGKGGDKFGWFLEGNKQGFQCFRCGTTGRIKKLLIKINRKDLLIQDESLSLIHDKIEPLFIEEIENLACKEVKPPLGFHRIKKNEYLDSRNFTPDQYEQFHVGISIEPKLKGYTTFLLYENGVVVGYLSRSPYDKDWHKKNDEDSKKGLCKRKPRYSNSEDSDFEKIVGGLDEVVEGITKTVILVEGLMDKANTDRQLCLNDSDEVKCCFTFGNKVSDHQAKKLRNKGVKNIICLYDYGTIKQVQEFSLRIIPWFETVRIGEIIWDTDPGEMSLDEFEYVLNHLKKPLDFKVNRLTSKLNI